MTRAKRLRHVVGWILIAISIISFFGLRWIMDIAPYHEEWVGAWKMIYFTLFAIVPLSIGSLGMYLADQWG